jgi:purine-binding chemotaxis protein CheW
LVREAEPAEAGFAIDDGLGDSATAAVSETAAAEPEILPESAALSEYGGLEDLVAEIDRETALRPDESLFGEDTQPLKPAAQRESCVVFLLNGTRYALPIRSVLELDAVPRITPVPNVPGFVRGVTNLRGEILAVLDLRTLLGLPPADTPERGRILIVRTADQPTAAMAVDEVRGTVGLALEELVRPASPLQDKISPVLLGVGEHQNHVLNVLDVDKLFHTPELQQLTAN